MPAALRRTGSALALAASLVACTTDVRGAASPAGALAGTVELVRGDACRDVFFWAATASGELAVTVTVDVADRPADGPTEVSARLPDPGVTVEVLRGPGDLTVDLCTDALVGVEPTGRQSAVAGDLAMTVDPPGEDCGESDGRLRIEGLVAEDGTAFAPIDVVSVLVGCNVGG
ncbi:hypothetical protein [Blastococcus sp. SYSU D00695]